MRIVFLCTSLEPGRDGVGDYARRLAGEMVRQDHVAVIIALRERGSVTAEEEQDAGGVPIAVLRLPAKMSRSLRAARGREWIARFRPDWISVQFVCFGHHPKGLVHGTAGLLRRMVGDTPIHWMFHELWVGYGKAEPWRFKLWGVFQRASILGLYRSLGPAATDTSNALYQRMLREVGIESGILPVFGNIPVCSPTGWMTPELERLGIRRAERPSWILLGVFGSIAPEWTAEGWLEYLAGRADGRGRRIALLGIGRVTAGDLERFKAVALGECRIVAGHFGSQEVARISEFLQVIDGGISTGIHSLLGKSGSAAAMREHNVPLLVTRVDGEADRVAAAARVRGECDAFLLQLDSRRPPMEKSQLTLVARRLAARLEPAIAPPHRN